MFSHIVFHTFSFSILSNQVSHSTPQSQPSNTLLPQPAALNTTATDESKSTSLINQEIDIPKSPPKWPLRPGVLVHVKDDTKEQLHAVRIQSPTGSKSLLNSSGISASTVVTNNSNNTNSTPLSSLPSKNPFRVSRPDSNSLNEMAAKNSNNDELIKFINSKLLQRILRKLKLRRINIKEASEEDEEDDDVAIDGSSFKRRNDYRFRIQSKASWKSNWDTWAWFGSNKSTRSNKSLVDNHNNNHISGIECSEQGKITISSIILSLQKIMREKNSNKSLPKIGKKKTTCLFI